MPREILWREGEDLAQRAYFRFIPTPQAAFQPEDHEKDGILLLAAAPVRDAQGKVRGALYGGILLNRDYEIVDKVKDIVFKGEKYKGKEIGTVTIFQRDLRVSINVTAESSQRAIGTRVSQEVAQTVLKNGQPWTDRAFVVNHWYRPLINLSAISKTK